MSEQQANIKVWITEKAESLSFDTVGFVATPVNLQNEYYLRWIAEKKHGNMSWFERNNERRMQPRKILPKAKSIICLGVNYYQDNPERRSRIAKYALGKDYHSLIYKKLKKLCRLLSTEFGSDQKPYVDTGPVLEKPIAVQAGLGWQGKSTILINRKFGTWLFLGVIITTLEIAEDVKPVKDHCGSCHRCIDACPTGAITGPYQLDARRCISYLTIEHRGSIPVHYRRAIGDRVYGCDECLDVCPWNRWAKQTQESHFKPFDLPDIRSSLSWTEEDFKTIFTGSAIKRIGLTSWLRNVCVVLGNIGSDDDIPELQRLAKFDDEIVSEHARWALAEIDIRAGRQPAWVN